MNIKYLKGKPHQTDRATEKDFINFEPEQKDEKLPTEPWRTVEGSQNEEAIPVSHKHAASTFVVRGSEFGVWSPISIAKVVGVWSTSVEIVNYERILVGFGIFLDIWKLNTFYGLPIIYQSNFLLHAESYCWLQNNRFSGWPLGSSTGRKNVHRKLWYDVLLCRSDVIYESQTSRINMITRLETAQSSTVKQRWYHSNFTNNVEHKHFPVEKLK